MTSYSAAIKSSLGSQDSSTTSQAGTVKGSSTRQNISSTTTRRSPSPSQQPKKATQDEAVYILTILTDQPHHERMTALRKKYFPRKLNKLDAHLTLFHALPEGRLEGTILPTIRQVASQTEPFSINARTPVQLGKHGIGIFVPRGQGGDHIGQIHGALKEPWKREGFLSVQDSGGVKAHYTVMNKVDDEAEVEAAYAELKKSFYGDEGTGEGIGLWRYDRGWWKWVDGFKFGA
ncbi:uncharacterized protein LTR77_001327 [Saxophila tyrrhenica]|uniref:Uncharacterized protein n=1 Tax=Saxophila tyrrhenica TaxID=1690608 RepID=A0AAV9PPK8_9PEZI|nr:hypothetical protein LTR77_001327 [Saxophila tyrrhenica]